MRTTLFRRRRIPAAEEKGCEITAFKMDTICDLIPHPKMPRNLRRRAFSLLALIPKYSEEESLIYRQVMSAHYTISTSSYLPTTLAHRPACLR